MIKGFILVKGEREKKKSGGWIEKFGGVLMGRIAGEGMRSVEYCTMFRPKSYGKEIRGYIQCHVMRYIIM